MKAIQISRYHQQLNQVCLVDVPRPPLRRGDVLVRVRFAGVNPLDNMIVRGEVRLVTPYTMPQTLGNELSGIVEAIGEGVEDFKIGDQVFGRLPTDRIGAFAEYVSVPSSALAHVPTHWTLSEAAAAPLAILTAAQAYDLMQVQAGESIFISGGSGSLGAMAIPLALSRGLKVYTNGNEQSRERILSLGVSQYLDYKRQDYLLECPKVDYVLDSLGGSATLRQMQLLKTDGHIVSLKGIPNSSFARRFGLPRYKQWLFALASLRHVWSAKRLKVRYDFLFVESSGNQLSDSISLMSTDQVKPNIEDIYPLSKAADALRHIDTRSSAGKVILEIP